MIYAVPDAAKGAYFPSNYPNGQAMDLIYGKQGDVFIKFRYGSASEC